ncbi:MAG TPA: lipocalin family protein [Flavobacterium sp.]|jgi:hypothetical protein|nr:lipocalin family protein [Flavobacterium sp.]
MKKIFPFLVILMFCACQQEVTQEDLANVNGYWEIKEVNSPDAEKKEYAMNDTYDYFELKGNQGSRRKVKPQLDGTFLTNDMVEDFEVQFADGKTYFSYSTPYAKWKEEVKSLTDSMMVIVNAEQKEFHYKKTGPINLLGDGEKTK